MLPWFAALLLTGMAPAQASDAPTVIIVEFPAGPSKIGEPEGCGAEPDTLCMMDLYQGPAKVVRHLSGPRVSSRSTVRFTGIDTPRWRGMRLMMVTVPFEDKGTVGNFALWWLSPETNGDYCLDAVNVEQMEQGPLRDVFAAGHKRRFKARGYDSVGDYRCVRG